MMEMFEPDYHNILEVMHNRRPGRLPLYEHNIDPPFISKVIGREILPDGLGGSALEDYYKVVTGFWREMTFDAFSYEAAICEIYPGHGAILGGMLGPIQNREDFNRYPWKEVPEIFWKAYTPHLDAIRKVMPEGMKAYGGCGYGIFESSEDLVGFESLAVMQYMDPDLFRDLFIRIGDLYVELWSGMVERYGDLFVFCRMGDDLGFKSSTLLEPDTIRKHILPQYRRVIDVVHGAGKKFLLHSCGCIFDVMEDIIALGIDAKHSNEDAIAPFERWIELYNDRIGLFGGIDVNFLCLNTYDEVRRQVTEMGSKFRGMAKGYGLGSGNSIAGYVPVEGFMGMVDAVKQIRIQ
jgi:uroporphyrinogen decarboxylase